ncbi:unnamed protein product [Arctia plantaginis]|uniref:Uncharacterized protein n=1 Tax=Arctia plantaginis TaxID=874455 RepID=A0A8S1A9K3_ARCPL|nr:unnamed protein product [Arctia plantaginis]
MVRTYKRKTDAGEWSQEKMKEAVNKVQNKELTLERIFSEEILPSPLKSPIASESIRKVTKLVLHLTSPQSKTTLLEKETKKKFKIDNKAKENKKKAVGKENTMKKMKKSLR